MADANMRIIIQAIDNASAQLNKVKSALNGMSGAGDEASESTEGLEKTSNLAFSKIAGYIATVTGAIYTMKKIWEFSEQGAQLLSLETASSRVAASMGGDMQEIISAIQEASLGTISYYDAMQSASNAMMLGLGSDTDKLANLMEIAAFRGRAMGLTTTQAFSDIVRGIGRMSPLILDNLGIVVDAESRYKVYAESIGKTAAQLSAAEKRQALFNGVLEEGNRLLAESGGLSADYATGMARATAAWKNYWDTVKTQAGASVGSFFLSQAERKQIFEEERKEILLSSTTYEEYRAAIKNASSTLRLYDEETHAVIQSMSKEAFIQAKSAQARHDAAISRTEEVDSIAAINKVLDEEKEKIKEANESMLYQIGISGDLKDIQEDYFLAIKKGGKEAKGAVTELTQATSAYFLEITKAAGLNTTQQIELAFAFGEIDTTSYAAALAIQQYTQYMQENNATMPESIRGMMQMKSNLDALMVNRSSTNTIDYIIRVMYQGVQLPYALAQTLLGLNNAQMAEATRLTLQAGNYGKDTGNTLIGGADGRASGGPVRGGVPYIVGERGPELFVPPANGNIVPNNALGAGGRAVAININYAPAISTASESELQWKLKPIIEKALKEM